MRAYRCGRATSRLVWFLLGAGTATWWITHHDYRAWHDLLAFGALIYSGTAVSLTKDLFSVNPHAFFDAGEDCGLNIEAFATL